MEDILIGSGIFVLVASVWFGIQTGVWLLSLPRVVDIVRVKQMLLASTVIGPLFVFGVLLVSGLASGNLDGWDLFLLPAMTGSATLISWLGLKVALRIKGRRQ